MPAITDPAAEEQSFGPAMLALDPRQRAFVIATFVQPGNATAAARAAGYERQSASAVRVQGHRLMNNPKIGAAILELGRTILQTATPQMVKSLMTLALTSSNEEIRRKASVNLLDRAGMTAVINVNHQHSHTLSYDEKLLELERLARLVGLDPARALEGLPAPEPVTTDAVFEVFEETRR